MLAQRHQEEERLEQYWRDQARRAAYEAHLARRLAVAVDPENRLVAASLERQWEEKQVLQRQAEEDAERFHQHHQLPILTAEMRYQLVHIGQVLPDLWERGKISNEYQKRLLRSLITRVIATRLAPDQIEVKIVWITRLTLLRERQSTS